MPVGIHEANYYHNSQLLEFHCFGFMSYMYFSTVTTSSEMFNISVCGCKLVKNNRWQIRYLTYKQTAGHYVLYAQTF